MSANEWDTAFFREANLNRDLVLAGMRGLLLGYLGKRSSGKRVLCEKHIGLMEYGVEIVHALQNVKFKFMIRDIRAKIDLSGEMNKWLVYLEQRRYVRMSRIIM